MALQLLNLLLHLQAEDPLLLRLKYRWRHLRWCKPLTFFCRDRSERMYQELPPSKNQPILSLGTRRFSTSWPGWTSSFPVLLHVGAVGQVSLQPQQQIQSQNLNLVDTPNSNSNVWGRWSYDNCYELWIMNGKLCELHELYELLSVALIV